MAQSEPKRISANYLYVAVFTTVTVLLWIGFEVFRSLTTPADIPQVSQAELTPISGGVDAQGLAAVRERLHVPQDILDALEGTPTLILPESPMTESTESASIETSPTQEATTSGAF